MSAKMTNNFDFPVWHDEARLYIRKWYEKNGLLIGTLTLEGLERVYQNHSSESAYISRYNKFSYIIQLLGNAQEKDTREYLLKKKCYQFEV